MGRDKTTKLKEIEFQQEKGATEVLRIICEGGCNLIKVLAQIINNMRTI
jgi:hypothetical protein